jgi:hypothetical protein
MKTSANLRQSVSAILMTSLLITAGVTPLANAQAPVYPPGVGANPDILIPGWVTWCATYWGKHLNCTIEMFNANAGYAPPAPRNPPVTTAPYRGPNWGTTEATASSLFPSTILANFTNNASINTQMSNMQWTMWAQLSTELTRLDTTETIRPQIFKLAAEKLNANNLIMFRSVFGATIDTYVTDYSPAAVKTAYAAGKTQPPLYLSTAYYASKGVAPPVFPSTMAYYDVYLMAYTQRSDLPNAAMKRATTYLQVRMKLGPLDVIYVLGAAAGIITLFDPSAWADFKQWWNNTDLTPPAIDWPSPTVILPPDGIPGGGYPGGVVPPTSVPLFDPTGGTYDPTDPTIPGYDFPGDDFYGWDFDGCLGLDSGC